MVNQNEKFIDEKDDVAFDDRMLSGQQRVMG